MTVIRKMRKAKGITGTALSFELSIVATTLSAVERGVLAASKNVREKLCAYFEVEDSILFDEKGLAK